MASSVCVLDSAINSRSFFIGHPAFRLLGITLRFAFGLPSRFNVSALGSFK
jgi:hypothetical protein